MSGYHIRLTLERTTDRCASIVTSQEILLDLSLDRDFTKINDWARCAHASFGLSEKDSLALAMVVFLAERELSKYAGKDPAFASLQQQDPCRPDAVGSADGELKGLLEFLQFLPGRTGEERRLM